MKRIILLSLFIFSFILLSAQNQNNNWYFGDSIGLNFSTSPPTLLTDGVMFGWEGCASISDEYGNLLFYTDGSTVYNKQHETMFNGTGLYGTGTTTQSAVICPYPLSKNKYYIFTVDYQFEDNGVRFSIVDMSLDGGLGQVTLKNQLLMPIATEKACIVRHANNVDYWAVFHDCNNNCFHSYQITPDRVDTIPVISCTGTIIPNPDSYNSIGYLKVNKDCNMIVSAVTFMHFFELFDFDNATGILSNPISIPENYPYGAEFSPNGQVLYLSCGILFDATIKQYNLSNYNYFSIRSSGLTVDPQKNLIGALELGPDNKIYCSTNYNGHMPVINRPDSIGDSCNYVREAIFLGGRYTNYGLPTLVYKNLFFEEEEEDILTSTIFFPNVFTPNNDGYNDKFYPIFENIEDYQIVIYNKWGTKVFETDDITEAWDGKYKGNDCSAGVYYWVAEFSSYKEDKIVKEYLKRTVDLVRN